MTIITIILTVTTHTATTKHKQRCVTTIHYTIHNCTSHIYCWQQPATTDSDHNSLIWQIIQAPHRKSQNRKFWERHTQRRLAVQRITIPACWIITSWVNIRLCGLCSYIATSVTVRISGCVVSAVTLRLLSQFEYQAVWSLQLHCDFCHSSNIATDRTRGFMSRGAAVWDCKGVHVSWCSCLRL